MTCPKSWRLFLGFLVFWDLFYFILFIYFWLCHGACGIFIPWPGIESVPPALGVQSLRTLFGLRKGQPDFYTSVEEMSLIAALWLWKMPHTSLQMMLCRALHKLLKVCVGRRFLRPHAQPSWDCPLLRFPKLQLLVLIFSPLCDLSPKIQSPERAASDFIRLYGSADPKLP